MSKCREKLYGNVTESDGEISEIVWQLVTNRLKALFFFNSKRFNPANLAKADDEALAKSARFKKF